MDNLETTHLQLRRVPTQVYPDNTRILSAPVTEGNAPSEGGWGEIILLVDLLDFMASRPKGGIISFVFELNFGLLTNLLSGLAPLTQFLGLRPWMS